MALWDRLASRDAKALRRFLATLSDKRTYVRVLALCLLAEGVSAEAVITQLQVSQRQLYRWLHQYFQGHAPAALQDQPRSGRPRTAPQLSEDRIVEALRLAPRSVGFSHNAWTVATLAQYLNQQYGTKVSVATLRRRMHDIGLRYKLPKYVYEEKEPNRAQKKGRLSANSASAPAAASC